HLHAVRVSDDPDYGVVFPESAWRDFAGSCIRDRDYWILLRVSAGIDGGARQDGRRADELESMGERRNRCDLLCIRAEFARRVRDYTAVGAVDKDGHGVAARRISRDSADGADVFHDIIRL